MNYEIGKLKVGDKITPVLVPVNSHVKDPKDPCPVLEVSSFAEKKVEIITANHMSWFEDHPEEMIR